jgi:hypothetical protein
VRCLGWAVFLIGSISGDRKEKCANSANFFVVFVGPPNMDRKDRAFFEILKNESRAMITHESEPPSDEVQKIIVRFARGSVTAEERAHLCETLQERPDWVRLLADEVKSLRRGRLI